MVNTSPLEIVDRYFAAWTGQDFATARQLLHDDLSFQGPLDTFHNADDYLNAIRRLASIVKTVEKRKVFVDGQDVCEIYDLVTNTLAGMAPVAEWHQVKGDKIAMIRVFFDARPFGPPSAH